MSWKRLRRAAAAAAAILAGGGIASLAPVEDRAWPDADRAATFESMRSALANRRAADRDAPLLAGAARVELFEPGDPEVPLGGNRVPFARRTTELSDEGVWVRALALRQGERRAFVVSADVLVIPPDLQADVIARVASGVVRSAGELLLAATHTHTGPGGHWRGFLPERSVGRFSPEARERLVDRCARAVEAAWSRLAQVRVSHGAVDVVDPVHNRIDFDGIENPAFSGIRLETIDGGAMVEVLNYSAHPTARLTDGGERARRLSGDYPGVLSQLLEDERTTVLFLPGTLGDQRVSSVEHGEGVDKTRTVAEFLRRHGHDRIEWREEPQPTLDAFEFELHLPAPQLRPFHAGFAGSWRIRDWLARRLHPPGIGRTSIQVVALGPIVLLGAPCDLSTSVGLPLLVEARALGLHATFASLADDWIGYVLRRDEYFGSYMAYAQFHGPAAGDAFTETYRVLLSELARGSR